MKKILIISLNNISENTGGGHYFRALVAGYQALGNRVATISKFNREHKTDLDNSNNFFIKKNMFTDLISRLILSPTFIAFYIPYIFIKARKFDVIALHSSRLGGVAAILRICGYKNIVMHFDNVESDLIKQSKVTLSLKGAIIIVDRILVPLAEFLAIKASQKLTFITIEDKNHFQQKYKNKLNQVVLPFCLNEPIAEEKLKNHLNSKTRNDKPMLLFTGSFDFFPNIDAFETILSLAKKKPDFIFVVVGRKLNKIIENKNLPINLVIYSDVTKEQLEVCYLDADIFFCPVRLGSGMKTKIAEALSFGLPVISDLLSSTGYNEAITSDVLVNIDSRCDIHSNDLENKVKCFLDDFDVNRRARAVYNSNYGASSFINSIKKVLNESA